MLSELPFSSYLSYDPRPSTKEEVQAKAFVVNAIKFDRLLKTNTGYSTAASLCAESLRDHQHETPFADLFATQPMLIPIPGSSKTQPGTLWVPSRFVIAMAKCGLGTSNACLKRVQAVQKSAFAKPGQRPTAQEHYDSMKVDGGSLTERGRIILVDDVVTRGATMLGAASRVAEAFPNAEIVGFAMVRVVGWNSKFKALADPVGGQISLSSNGNTHRDP